MATYQPELSRLVPEYILRFFQLTPPPLNIPRSATDKSTSQKCRFKIALEFDQSAYGII